MISITWLAGDYKRTMPDIKAAWLTARSLHTSPQWSAIGDLKIFWIVNELVLFVLEPHRARLCTYIKTESYPCCRRVGSLFSSFAEITMFASRLKAVSPYIAAGLTGTAVVCVFYVRGYSSGKSELRLASSLTRKSFVNRQFKTWERVVQLVWTVFRTSPN